MRAAILSSSLVCFAAGQLFGQAPDKTLTFEAASVKPAAAPVPDGRGRIMIAGPSGGPGTKDPGRIRYPFMNLKQLLTTAYDVKAYQISGPAWLDSERYDITATMAPGTTKEQFQVMLQNLLAERFKVAIHRETKELPMYSLVVAKSGSKLKRIRRGTAGEGRRRGRCPSRCPRSRRWDRMAFRSCPRCWPAAAA